MNLLAQQQQQLDLLQKQLNPPNEKFNQFAIDRQNFDNHDTNEYVAEDIKQELDEEDNLSKGEDQSQNNQEVFLENEREFLALKDRRYQHQFDPKERVEIKQNMDKIFDKEFKNLGLPDQMSKLNTKSVSELRTLV